MNNFFKKGEHRKLTWVSPYENTENKLELIITDKQKIDHDVTMLITSFSGQYPQDVQCKSDIKSKRERTTFINRNGIKWNTIKDRAENKSTITKRLRYTNERSGGDLNNTTENSTKEAQQKHCSK